jgi:hypothetical protein
MRDATALIVREEEEEVLMVLVNVYLPAKESADKKMA